jgi:phage shock protein A
VSRFEDKIRREEAKVRGASELAASSLDAQFNQLDDLGELSEVDARLAELKAGSVSSAPQPSIAATPTPSAPLTPGS